MIKIGLYDYEGLIKSYLMQDKSSALTAGNRMSYQGSLLYSYNSILATISTIAPNTLYIYKETANYSNTSKNHASILRIKTVSLNWNTFDISREIPLEGALPMYWKEIELLITRYKRARTLKHSIKQSIHEAISNAQHFAECHKLDPTIPDILMRQLFVNQLLK